MQTGTLVGSDRFHPSADRQKVRSDHPSVFRPRREKPVTGQNLDAAVQKASGHEPAGGTAKYFEGWWGWGCGGGNP